ncbi:hypothetical protein CHMI_01132 [Cellulomonas hominis]|nr:hypothetical protein CHMI_01132 [Cellulomonas hominis]
MELEGLSEIRQLAFRAGEHDVDLRARFVLLNVTFVETVGGFQVGVLAQYVSMGLVRG